LVAPAWGGGRRHALKGLLFDGHVGVQVGGGGANVGVSEPEGDDGRVDPVLQKVHGAGMPKDVRVDPVSGEAVVAAGGGACVFGDDPFNCVGAEPASGPGREQRLVS